MYARSYFNLPCRALADSAPIRRRSTLNTNFHVACVLSYPCPAPPLAGGYLNTCCNVLAPAQVRPELAGRATAVMALIFNVAHIGGLILAAAVAAAVFGDVVG